MKKQELKPTAKVSVKKSVRKQYKLNDEKVYFLKDGTEFEIELFNPLQETIMCKVFFNGKMQDTEGLVLYPGQRVFLERYLDNDKRLKYNTYLIEENQITEYATRNNGLIEVRFHKEVINNYWSDNTITITPNYGTYYYTNTTNTTGDFTLTAGTSLTAGTVINTTADNLEAFTCSTAETGVVSKGSISDQSFVNTYEQFNLYAFNTEKFRLLPESKKVKTKDDLKVKRYCTECGKKARPKDKFCSACGTKLN